MPNDYTHVDYEATYQDAMRDYADAATDEERDDALMLAGWALMSLTDTIEQLREQLREQLMVTS